MRARVVALLPLVLVALSACLGDDSGANPQNAAYLRFVHASTGTGTAQVRVGDDLVVTSISFGGVTGCVPIPSDAPTVTFLVDGQAVATLPADFQVGRAYVTVLTGTTAATRGALLLDDRPPTSPGPGRMFVRFVNATASAGQVFATTPGGAPGAATLFAASGVATDFADLAETSNRLRLFEGSTTPPPATPLADVTIDPALLPASGVATVVFTGATPGRTATGLGMRACS